MDPTDREPRHQTTEVLRIIRLKRGEVANVRWDDGQKVYVVEIAKAVVDPHNGR